MYTDTDSMWIAFSEENPFGLPEKLAPTAEEANYDPNPGLCKQGLEKEFEEAKNHFMVMNQHDIRTPGPMKTEYEAASVVCLAPKSPFKRPLRRKEARGHQPRYA